MIDTIAMFVGYAVLGIAALCGLLFVAQIAVDFIAKQLRITRLLIAAASLIYKDKERVKAEQARIWKEDKDE